MTAIQPVNIFRAYKILISLPSGVSREEAIELLINIFGFSKVTAKIYLRALKKWGFISGEDEISVEKPPLDDYIRRIRGLLIEELGEEFFTAFKQAINILFNTSMDNLICILRERGFNISTWKFKTVIRLLKQTNLLLQRQTYDLSDIGVSLADIIYGRLLACGRCKLSMLLDRLSSELGLNRCELKRVIAKLIEENKLLMDAPSALIKIWIQCIHKNYCDSLRAHLSEFDKQTLDELKVASIEHPDVVSFEDNRVIVKIFEGDFLVIPIRSRKS